MSDKINYAKYTRRDCNTLKDGHVMFPEDIIKDLNRKSFLESDYKELKEENTDLNISIRNVTDQRDMAIEALEEVKNDKGFRGITTYTRITVIEASTN